jgi:hypothetical protein
MIRTGMLLMLVVTLSEGCKEQPDSIAVKVLSANTDAIVISVRNDSRKDIILLSPLTPNRTVDQDACTLRLSTKIDDIIRPFAFTPQLVAVRGRTEQRFRVLLHPVRLSTTCGAWHVMAEYAYVDSDLIERFSSPVSEEFRQHILRSQHLVASNDFIVLNEQQ